MDDDSYYYYEFFLKSEIIIKSVIITFTPRHHLVYDSELLLHCVNEGMNMWGFK